MGNKMHIEEAIQIVRDKAQWNGPGTFYDEILVEEINRLRQLEATWEAENE